MKSFDLEKIENLRIHELRDVAREIGVKSPTSLNRPELVQQIRLIIAGEQKPYFNVRKQGRPARHEDLDVSSLITPNEDELYSDPLTKPWNFAHDNPAYMLKCNEADFDKVLPTDKPVSGYVDIHPDGYGLLRRNGFMPSSNDTFIPHQIVTKYQLVSGMHISGVERFVATGKPLALVSVNSREIPPSNYDMLLGRSLGETIKSYLNMELHTGGRYFIKNEKPNDIFLNAYDIASSIVKDRTDINCKVIFTKSLPERLPQIVENVEILDVPFNKTDNDVINTVNLFIAKAKLDALKGKVVIVLTGLSDIAKAYNNVLNGNCEDIINLYTAPKVNNLLACAKNISTNSNITLIVLDNMKVTEKMNNLFEYEILPNFNN